MAAGPNARDEEEHDDILEQLHEDPKRHKLPEVDRLPGEHKREHESAAARDDTREAVARVQDNDDAVPDDDGDKGQHDDFEVVDYCWRC